MVNLRHRSLRQGPARARPHRTLVRLLVLRGLASDDIAELFAEERPVTAVPEPHAEEGKAKDPVAPDV